MELVGCTWNSCPNNCYWLHPCDIIFNCLFVRSSHWVHVYQPSEYIAAGVHWNCISNDSIHVPNGEQVNSWQLVWCESSDLEWLSHLVGVVKNELQFIFAVCSPSQFLGCRALHMRKKRGSSKTICESSRVFEHAQISDGKNGKYTWVGLFMYHINLDLSLTIMRQHHPLQCAYISSYEIHSAKILREWEIFCPVWA